MNEELIDDPKDDLVSKKPSGNEKEIRINRFIISYPFENELLISEHRSSKLFPFAPVIIFGGMGGFFGFLTIHYGIEEPFHAATIMCFCFFLFMSGLVAIVLTHHYASSRTYTFDKDEFRYNGLLWFKKRFDREDVKSVFISETITRTQGSSSVNYRFGICLRVPMTQFKDGYPICDIELKDSWKGAINGSDYDSNEQAKIEARHICELIAEHWTIPVSI